MAKGNVPMSNFGNSGRGGSGIGGAIRMQQRPMGMSNSPLAGKSMGPFFSGGTPQTGPMHGGHGGVTGYGPGGMTGRFAPQILGGQLSSGQMGGGFNIPIDHAPMGPQIAQRNQTNYQGGSQLPRVPMGNPQAIPGSGYGTGSPLMGGFDINKILQQLGSMNMGQKPGNPGGYNMGMGGPSASSMGPGMMTWNM